VRVENLILLLGIPLITIFTGKCTQESAGKISEKSIHITVCVCVCVCNTRYYTQSSRECIKHLRGVHYRPCLRSKISNI
jgi:hypothetical protein